MKYRQNGNLVMISLLFWLGFNPGHIEIWALFKATPGWQKIDEQEARFLK